MADNVKAWVNELRTTTDGQTRNRLGVIHDEGGASFCCLGLGSRLVPLVDVRPRPGLTALTFNGYTSNAPPEFIEWLGLALPEDTEHFDDGDGFDVVLDVPSYLTHQRLGGHVTAAALNDGWDLTFDQIADMIEYFGLRRAVGGVGVDL